MERMSRIMKDLIKHTLMANGMTMLQTKSKITNKNLSSKMLIKKFKMGIHCRGPNRRALLQTRLGKKIETSQKTLKDFLSTPIF